MFRSVGIRVLISLLLVSSLAVPARGAVNDPSGHWEGSIRSPQGDVRIEIDLAKSAEGGWGGVFGNPVEKVKVPLPDVTWSDGSLAFALKASAGGGTFRATLGADGKSMQGTFTLAGDHAVELPFDLTRTGDAKIDPPPSSPSISKELEGKWTGTLEVEGSPRQVGLTLTNGADGRSTGVVLSSQGMEIPITAIVQKGASVTLDVKNIGGTFAGTLNVDGTQLSGTWTQGSFTAPLTFRRPSPASTSTTPIDRWAEAVGGRNKVSEIRTIYREATIEVAGMRGSLKVWHTADGRYRKEEEVGTFSNVEIFDGTIGTTQQGVAPARKMTPTETALARSKAFANANAMLFAFFPERRRGSVSVEPDGTIVLLPEGGVEWRVTLDPQTSLPATMLHKEGDRTITVTIAEYQTVDGIKMEKEIRRTMGDPRFNAVIRFTKTVLNPPVDAALFATTTP